MKYVMTFECDPDFGPLPDSLFKEHLDLLKDFHRRGELLLMGPLQEPANGDALAVFVSREAAEEFVAKDPFVTHGLVTSWTIRQWKEVLLPEPAV